MLNMPFFKFDADDWLTGKIQLLSASEKGIFIDICARIWRENGLLKNDDNLYRLLRVDKGSLGNSLKAFFELQIMCENDGYLSVKFIEKQIDQRKSYIEKQRNFGAIGGTTRRAPQAKQKAESRKQKEYKEKNIIKKDDAVLPLIAPVVAVNHFENFWTMYDLKTDRKKCESVFAKLKEEEIKKIFEVLPSYVARTDKERSPNSKKTYRKNPLTWLNGKCWNDEVTKSSDVGQDYLEGIK